MLSFQEINLTFCYRFSPDGAVTRTADCGSKMAVVCEVPAKCYAEVCYTYPVVPTKTSRRIKSGDGKVSCDPQFPGTKVDCKLVTTKVSLNYLVLLIILFCFSAFTIVYFVPLSLYIYIFFSLLFNNIETSKHIQLWKYI